MLMKFKLSYLSILFVMTIAGCRAQTVPAEWKTDCVGRMQVSLPGNAEIAVTHETVFMDSLGMASRYEWLPDFAFNDNTPANFAALSYKSNELNKDVNLLRSFRISPIRTSEDLNIQFATYLDKVYIESKKEFDGKTLKDGIKRKYEIIDTGNKNITAFRSQPYDFDAQIRFDDRLVNLSFYHHKNDTALSNLQILNLLSNFKSRSIFNVPTQTGVCLPYLHLQDKGTEPRNIKMTYRLTDHPEIQITIKDETSTAREPGNRTKNAEPLPVMQSFWDQHLTTFAKDAKNEWLPGGHAVTLAGYKGLSSFIKLIRPNGAEDYGYLAVVRGNPDATEDTPDLMVYVIRDSYTVQGKPLMPRDEFLKMAETIAASLKRRPVQ